MDETDFWELVDAAREASEGDPEEQADVLIEQLTRRDPEGVADFARHFDSRFHRAHQWDVWAAATVLLGSAGEPVDDETFDSFRCWLIGQGREVFEAAAHDADSLADLLTGFDPQFDGEGEDLGYAADEAYEQLTATALPDLGLPEPPEEPTGTPLDLDDDEALADRLPRLWDRVRG
ncbi:DUF4240 domain-containing protein [Streptomyces xiaopingdaonensis]|uniref:DUF4240 domain-containing protein n=1 Tax=Streptomyces xiaopingdaonensis TaxID=1565415 RepID=UPI000368060A|nr:DUF4240 domain-containing protein [Streptomyces xiaopingdaonensis]